MQLGFTPLRTKLPKRMLYQDFAKYGQRLKTLNEYLDAQRPEGIRGLWVDGRNANAWWTFWTVIVVGIVTIGLTLVSLAVSIIQTVYTYRGFQLQSGQPAV